MQFKPPSQPGEGPSEPVQQELFPGWQQQPSMHVPTPPQQTSYPQWPQLPTYPPQQLMYPSQPQQWPQQPPLQPQKPSKIPKNKKVGIGCGVVAVVLVLIVVISVAVQGSATPTTSTDSSTPAAQTTPASDQSTPVDQSTPTTQPTVPTVSPAELELVYKASTTDTTVATLDKDGNANSGKDVHFTATILNFVKDSSGNTAGANLDDPNAVTGVVQIAFPTGTDLSQLNTSDVLEVWGTDGGTASGQNAFGATVQEVVISANYMTDKTTGYQTL